MELAGSPFQLGGPQRRPDGEQLGAMVSAGLPDRFDGELAAPVSSAHRTGEEAQ